MMLCIHSLRDDMGEGTKQSAKCGQRMREERKIGQGPWINLQHNFSEWNSFI